MPTDMKNHKWMVLSNTTLGMLAATINASIVLISLPAIFRGQVSERMRALGYHLVSEETLQVDCAERFILDGEAFPAGRYRLSLGPKLRFVVP